MSYCNRNAKNSSFFSALGSQDQVRKSNESDWFTSYILNMWVDILPKTFYIKNLSTSSTSKEISSRQLNLPPLLMARASHTITDTWWWSIVVLIKTDCIIEKSQRLLCCQKTWYEHSLISANSVRSFEGFKRVPKNIYSPYISSSSGSSVLFVLWFGAAFEKDKVSFWCNFWIFLFFFYHFYLHFISFKKRLEITAFNSRYTNV